MNINYNELTLAQIKKINKQSADAIASFEKRKRKEAISKATAIAREAGFFSLQEMITGEPVKRKLLE